MMNYEIMDDVTEADIAVKVRGSSLEELFINGAGALVSEMTGGEFTSTGNEVYRGEVESGEIDLLYFNFLNELLFFKDAAGLLLLPDIVEIKEEKGLYKCIYTLRGGKISDMNCDFRADIKAVTMHRLKLYKHDDFFIAESVFDV